MIANIRLLMNIGSESGLCDGERNRLHDWIKKSMDISHKACIHWSQLA